MVGNHVFRPSVVEDTIYSIMDDFIAGSDTYEEALVGEIGIVLQEKWPAMEWQMGCSEWPNCSGGVCYVSWIENGHLHMIGFDYKKEGEWL